MDDKQLLAEVDAVFRGLPPVAEFAKYGGAADEWLGRANAVLDTSLDTPDKIELHGLNKAIEAGSYAGTERPAALRGVVRLLQKVRHKLLMNTGGTGTVAVDHGMHFQYFEAVREIVQGATSEVFFVDQYLNDEVLTKFAEFIKPGVAVRLLGGHYVNKLQPSAAALNKQRGQVELRTSPDVHDRFLFIDRGKCHFSGASFKDGPTKGPSIVSELVDGMADMLAIYEKKWAAAQPIGL